MPRGIPNPEDAQLLQYTGGFAAQTESLTFGVKFSKALQYFKCLPAKHLFCSRTAAGATQIATAKITTTVARSASLSVGSRASPSPATYFSNRSLIPYHSTFSRPLSTAMAAISGPSMRKRINSDAGIEMKRAPDGSAFLTCESCKMQIPIATADMHDCQGAAAFKESLEKMRKVYAEQGREQEATKQTKKPKAIKAKEPKAGKAEKKVKDPNEPKRPVSSYFIFLEAFRKTFKEENPDVKGVIEVTKAAGAKWKEMTDEDKKPYAAEQEKRKAEYDAKMVAYASTKPEASEGANEGSGESP